MKPLVFPSQFQGAHFYFSIELFSNLEYQNPNKYSLVADPTYPAEFVLEGFQKMDLSKLASIVLDTVALELLDTIMLGLLYIM